MSWIISPYHHCWFLYRFIRIHYPQVLLSIIWCIICSILSWTKLCLYVCQLLFFQGWFWIHCQIVWEVKWVYFLLILVRCVFIFLCLLMLILWCHTHSLTLLLFCQFGMLILSFHCTFFKCGYLSDIKWSLHPIFDIASISLLLILGIRTKLKLMLAWFLHLRIFARTKD